MSDSKSRVRYILKNLKSFGVQQKSIAVYLGVTDSVLSQWKSGFRQIPEGHMDSLVHLLYESTPESKRDFRFTQALKDYDASLAETEILRVRLFSVLP